MLLTALSSLKLSKAMAWVMRLIMSMLVMVVWFVWLGCSRQQQELKGIGFISQDFF